MVDRCTASSACQKKILAALDLPKNPRLRTHDNALCIPWYQVSTYSLLLEPEAVIESFAKVTTTTTVAALCREM